MTSTHTYRRRVALAYGVVAAMGPWVVARAQPTFPSKPIQLVVGAPAGGPSDSLARSLADEMSKVFGQPIVIDNRPGAGGVLAAEFTARATPDGYTLMLSWLSNASTQSLLPKLSYDINRDFVHITQVAAGFNVLVAHPMSGIRTLKEFVSRAKAQPGKLSYASSGNGSSGHLAMEMLKQRAGISVLHIPYRGGAPAMNDLLGGQVDLMFINQDAVIPYLRNGKLLPLAVTSAARSPLFPDLPTVAESGYPGFEATAWAGLSAPRATPAPVVERIQAVARQALRGPFKAKQEAMGAQVVGSSSSEYTAFIRSETEKWSRVIRAAGIKPD